MKTKKYYTVKEVAQLIGLDRTTVYKLLRTKKIAGRKVKKHIFANKADMWEISPKEFHRLEEICSTEEERRE